tara:strand:- start:48 stop:263 length:216 start_codon:yes stop_codon:yes gene_type:complete
MGEAKRRKELGLPPREKPIKTELPKFDKEALQNKIRSFLYKNQIIPVAFYAAAIVALAWGAYNLLKVYKLI